MLVTASICHHLCTAVRYSLSLSLSLARHKPPSPHKPVLSFTASTAVPTHLSAKPIQCARCSQWQSVMGGSVKCSRSLCISTCIYIYPGYRTTHIYIYMYIYISSYLTDCRTVVTFYNSGRVMRFSTLDTASISCYLCMPVAVRITIPILPGFYHRSHTS